MDHPETITCRSSVGILEVRISKEQISLLKFSNKKIIQGKNLHPLIQRAIRQLQEYVKNERQAFDLPLELQGTPFQQVVWRETMRIPSGETRTYAEIAKAIGKPKAVRAVGTALKMNPVCILVPCHRVVPSSGGIGNYAGGKEKKEWLLAHEKTA